MRGLAVALALLAGLAAPGVARSPATAAAGPETPEGARGRPNRLLHESSPYLRLHAYNPVDWYPWGEEALARARRENRPIFLSVGYSTCYWCHVMEREVFSDPEIARQMNLWFVNVKVDREERPDLDEIYMAATQVMTGSGGWPNSVFLTPALEPFFAGTYFPPEDRHGRPGFPRVLAAVREAWAAQPEQVARRAAEVVRRVRTSIAPNEGSAAAAPDGRAAARRAAEGLAARYDAEHGGFGRGQKFPSPGNLFLLWDRAERGDAEAREMVLHTLRRMGRGAIYDQLDGGFHRYTLDAAWRVPHFEKMLYDNALLGELLAVTAAATGDAELERLARGTLDFVLGWMRLPNGAFKSAIDAETDAVEGAYYVWTRDEARRALGDDGWRLVAPIFGLDGEPNFEGDRYTLYLTASLEEHASRLGIARAALLERLEPHLAMLRLARAGRRFPRVDDKVLTDWNGMMVAALARAGRLLGEPRYVTAAVRASRFLLTLRNAEGVLLHTWRAGEGKIAALLDDYAFLVRALLALDEATGDAGWLAAAERLSYELEERLRDPAGGYFMSVDRPDLLLRAKTAADGAVPSGNGVMALNLVRLAERTGQAVYRRRAAAALAGLARELEAYPQAVPTLALAAARHADLPSGAGEAGAATRTAAEAASPALADLAREVVRAAARHAGPPGRDGWRPFLLELELRDGWHVNANPASTEFLIPTRVDGLVRDVVYPPGERLRFPFAEEEIAVYTGRAAVRGEIDGVTDSLRLTYQACDDRRCLPPVTETVRLTVD